VVAATAVAGRAGRLCCAAGAWRLAQALWSAGSFATAWLAGTFWWLFISMHVYGGLPAPLAVLAVLCWRLSSARTTRLAAACSRRLRGPAGARGALFAALWLAAELLRGTWFTGFPWGAGGYAHVDGPLARAGARGSACTASARRWRAWSGLAVSLLAQAACARRGATGHPPSRRAGPSRPRVQRRRRDAGPALASRCCRATSRRTRSSRAAAACRWRWPGTANSCAAGSLVVAPETALPLLPQQLPEGYLEAMRDRFAEGHAGRAGRHAAGQLEEGYTNSVIGFQPQSRSGLPLRQAPPGALRRVHPALFKWFTG
jgi:apolipoprotein N-acyltransferase